MGPVRANVAEGGTLALPQAKDVIVPPVVLPRRVFVLGSMMNKSKGQTDTASST